MNTGQIKQDTRSHDRLSAKGMDLRLLELFQAVGGKPGAPRFIITEGMRTPKRQIELLASGASRTLNSKHLIGKACDVAILIGREVRWDWPLYAKFAALVKHTASELNIPLQWGGDWPRFKDGPHFELVD